MSHWRKRNPPATRFNGYIYRSAIAFSALAGMLLLLSIHGNA
jgi:hypothetical protein